MGDMDQLTVRFHHGGEFYFDGNRMHYLGGSESMSYIERELIQKPEIVGHLKGHGVVVSDVMLHWLFPSKIQKMGLGCCMMTKHAKTSHIVSQTMVLLMYLLNQWQCNCKQLGRMSEVMVKQTTLQMRREKEHQLILMMAVEMKYSSWGREKALISKMSISRQRSQSSSCRNVAIIRERQKHTIDSSSDSEYLPSGFCSSDEDEEAIKIDKISRNSRRS